MITEMWYLRVFFLYLVCFASGFIANYLHVNCGHMFRFEVVLSLWHLYCLHNLNCQQLELNRIWLLGIVPVTELVRTVNDFECAC